MTCPGAAVVVDMRSMFCELVLHVSCRLLRMLMKHMTVQNMHSRRSSYRQIIAQTI